MSPRLCLSLPLLPQQLQQQGLTPEINPPKKWLMLLLREEPEDPYKNEYNS